MRCAVQIVDLSWSSYCCGATLERAAASFARWMYGRWRQSPLGRIEGLAKTRMWSLLRRPARNLGLADLHLPLLWRGPFCGTTCFWYLNISQKKMVQIGWKLNCQTFPSQLYVKLIPYRTDQDDQNQLPPCPLHLLLSWVISWHLEQLARLKPIAVSLSRKCCNASTSPKHMLMGHLKSSDSNGNQICRI